ncbi:MAG: DUF4331 family protein [Longimicrobiales bacterium]
MAGPHPLNKLRQYALVALGVGAVGLGVGRVVASDHQDTPEVELNPRMDINDVYAFPGAGGTSTDMITLVMTTSSPIASGAAAAFDPNLLYQFKIDRTGDGIEDLVIQATFNDAGGYTITGPVAPSMTGQKSTASTTGTKITGTVGQMATSGTTKVFAGLRADPFFIDLEQFFKIIPDRRPSTGPLSVPQTQTATAFRSPGVDLLRPFNALAIVIELPKSMLVTSTATDASFGLWGTISR